MASPLEEVWRSRCDCAVIDSSESVAAGESLIVSERDESLLSAATSETEPDDRAVEDNASAAVAAEPNPDAPDPEPTRTSSPTE